MSDEKEECPACGYDISKVSTAQEAVTAEALYDEWCVTLIAADLSPPKWSDLPDRTRRAWGAVAALVNG